MEDMYVANINGKKKTLRLKKHKNYAPFLVNGASCRYKISFDGEAGLYDKLHLKVKKLKNAKVYAVNTLSYTARDFTEHLPKEGEEVTTEFPYALYLTIQSTEK